MVKQILFLINQTVIFPNIFQKLIPLNILINYSLMNVLKPIDIIFITSCMFLIYCLVFNLFIYNTLSHYYLSKFVFIKNLTVGDLYYQLSSHSFSDKLTKLCYPKLIVHV